MGYNVAEYTEYKEFVKVDFNFHSPQFQYFKDGNLVKKWSMKKADSTTMICKIIDGQDMDKFEANRMKSMVQSVMDKVPHHTIKIIKKGQ